MILHLNLNSVLFFFYIFLYILLVIRKIIIDTKISFFYFINQLDLGGLSESCSHQSKMEKGRKSREEKNIRNIF